MAKTMHLRWLRFRRHVRLSGPRAAQRRTAAWLALPTFNETVTSSPAGDGAFSEVYR